MNLEGVAQVVEQRSESRGLRSTSTECATRPEINNNNHIHDAPRRLLRDPTSAVYGSSLVDNSIEQLSAIVHDLKNQEYFQLLETQVTPEMKAAQPRVMDSLNSPAAALETFSPSVWNGLKIFPVSFEVSSAIPASMVTKARTIKPDLYDHSKN